MIVKSISIGGSTAFTVTKLAITKDLSGRNATASIEVFADALPNPTDFDEVIIKDHNDNTIFGGYLTVIDRGRVDRTGVEFKLKAKDYNLLLETTLCTINHSSVSDRAIIQAEFSANLPEITTLTADIEIIKSSIDSLDARNISLAEMMKRLIGLTGGEFLVDFDKALHYYSADNNPAPFEISDQPHGENIALWSQDFAIVNQGARAPTAAAGTNWTSPTKVFVEDDDDAIYNNTTQDELKSTVFGFSVPTGVTITGVEVAIRGRAGGAPDPSRQISVGLTKDGTALAGTRKTLLLNLYPTYSTQTLGTDSDMWGTTITPAEANTSTFGILIKDNDATAGSLRIDSILVTVSYDGPWVLDDITITEDAVKSPGGDVDAVKLEETTGNNDFKIFQDGVTTPETGVAYTAFVFAKAAERDYVIVQCRDGSGGSAWFNLSTGTIGTVQSNVVANIEEVGGGWYKCSVTRVVSGSTMDMRVWIAKADNQSTYTGVAGNGVYIWGAQMGRSDISIPVPFSPAMAAGTNWTNPTNVVSSNDSRADYDDTDQDELKVTNFTADIPLSASIVGIEVLIEGFGDSATVAQRVIDVGLTLDGTTLLGTRKTLTLNQTTDTTQTLGSSTDLWGMAAIGSGQVNNVEFGVLIRDNDTTAAGLHLDHIQVNIHYTDTIPPYGQTQAASIAKAAHHKMEKYTTQFLNPGNDVTVRGGKVGGTEITANRTDSASIAAYRTFEVTVTDRNILNTTVAELRGDVILLERANPIKRGTFVTTADGLEIGQQVLVTNAAHFLTSEPFTIRRMVLTRVNRTVTEYKIDIGPIRDDLMSLIQRINRVAVADPVFPTADPPLLSVDTQHLVALAVTNAKIAVDAIEENVIKAAAVTVTKIGPDAVTTPKILAGAITTVKIDAGAVTANEIQANTITGAKIAAGSIGASDAVFAAAAIVEADIANLAVTNAKIGLLAVDTAQLQALAVTEAKIDSLAVTNAKIGNLAVDTLQIQALAVTGAKIDDATIGTAKIISLNADKINAGTITSVNVSAGTYTLTSGVNQMTIDGTDGFKQRNSSTGNFVQLLTGFMTISNSGGTSHVDIDTVSVSVESATARLSEMGPTAIAVNNSSGSARASLALVSNDGRVTLNNAAGSEMARLDAGGGLGEADSGYMLIRNAAGSLRVEAGVESGGDGEIHINSIKVLGPRGSAVTKPSGGGTVDTEARTAIDAIIDRLGITSGHGLIS